jgi:heme exporter protein C
METAPLVERPPALRWLGWAAASALLVTLALALFVARQAQESMGGDLQRIFYFHVPAAWVAYLAFTVTFLASIAYLRSGARRWDLLAHSAAEIGVVFCAIVLVTGPIWARPVWGTWWQWDARLTSTLILWLTYIGYLFIRSLADPGRAGRLAAVVGILGLVNVPIVHFSVYWWRTLHPSGPTPADLEAGASGLGTPELLTFFVGLAAFTLLFAWLLVLRVRLGRLRDEVERQAVEEEIAEQTPVTA